MSFTLHGSREKGTALLRRRLWLLPFNFTATSRGGEGASPPPLMLMLSIHGMTVSTPGDGEGATHAGDRRS